MFLVTVGPYRKGVIRTHQRLRRWTAGFSTAMLPIMGFVLAPPALALDDCLMDPASLQCVSQQLDQPAPLQPGDQFSQPAAVQPGDMFTPAGGGPPQIAAGPSAPGAPIVTAGGDLLIPAGPPAGPGAPIITTNGDTLIQSP